MGKGSKSILSTNLKALEQGAFQEFCLSFLPIYHDRFQGLERHGGTAEGKTRSGTPDLLKTDNDGTQIAVQCSTDKDYWKKLKDEATMKPCSDIIKCIEVLNNVKEIVLCSNQEIPTNMPNIQNEVINFANSRTNTCITLFSLSRFEEELLNNQNKYAEVRKRHLREFNKYLESNLSKSRAKEKHFQTIKEEVLKPLHRQLQTVILDLGLSESNYFIPLLEETQMESFIEYRQKHLPHITRDVNGLLFEDMKEKHFPELIREVEETETFLFRKLPIRAKLYIELIEKVVALTKEKDYHPLEENIVKAVMCRLHGLDKGYWPNVHRRLKESNKLKIVEAIVSKEEIRELGGKHIQVVSEIRGKLENLKEKVSKLIYVSIPS